MPGNSNYDDMLSTTIAKYRKKLTDNIFTDRVLSFWLTEKGRITFEDGGERILEPIIYAQNDTVDTYSGYDPIDLTPQTGITAAEFPWRQLAGSIAISGIEEAKNNGESAMLKLLDARVMQLEESLKEKLNTMLYADGTGNGGKDFLGLAALIGGTGTTVGNISGTTETWWRSILDATAETWAALYARAGHVTAYNSASKGNDHPDLILTTQAGFEAYEKTLTGLMRYTDTKLGDSGFQNLMFKQAPMVFDASCTTGVMYMINSKYLGLTGHSNRWFKQGPFVTPDNVDARFSLITAFGNMTIRNRARHAKLSAKT